MNYGSIMICGNQSVYNSSITPQLVLWQCQHQAVVHCGPLSTVIWWSNFARSATMQTRSFSVVGPATWNQGRITHCAMAHRRGTPRPASWFVCIKKIKCKTKRANKCIKWNKAKIIVKLCPLNFLCLFLSAVGGGLQDGCTQGQTRWS